MSAHLFGPVSAGGRLHFGEGRVSPDGGTSLPVRVTLQPPEPAAELTLVGLASCRAGIVRARLTAEAGRSEPRVLSAALEAIYQPQLVSGALLGGFTVKLEGPGGSGIIDLAGFVGEARPEPTAMPRAAEISDLDVASSEQTHDDVAAPSSRTRPEP